MHELIVSFTVMDAGTRGAERAAASIDDKSAVLSAAKVIIKASIKEPSEHLQDPLNHQEQAGTGREVLLSYFSLCPPISAICAVYDTNKPFRLLMYV